MNTLALRAGLWLVAAPLLPAQISSAAVLIIIIADIALYLWQAVGLVRLGDACLRSFGSAGHVWAGLFGLMISLLASTTFWWQLVLISPLAPDRPEVLIVQPDAPALSLAVSPDGQRLMLSGEIPIAARRQVEAALRDNSDITQLDLTSPGGHIFAARDLARLVQSRGLNTRVVGTCSSACTLVFVAGETRSLTPGARLGFHSYALEIASGHPGIDLEAEMEIDLAYLRNRGLSEGFVARIKTVPSTSMWYPTQAELSEANVLRE